MSLLGLGSENLIQVETDDAFRVNVAEMRRVAKNLEKNFKVIESGRWIFGWLMNDRLLLQRSWKMRRWGCCWCVLRCGWVVSLKMLFDNIRWIFMISSCQRIQPLSKGVSSDWVVHWETSRMWSTICPTKNDGSKSSRNRADDCCWRWDIFPFQF